MSSHRLPRSAPDDLYPERPESRPKFTDKFNAAVGGFFAPYVQPRASRFEWIVPAVEAHAAEVEGMTVEEIRAAAKELAPELRREGCREDLLGRAFALARTAADRTVGLRPRDVQLIGGAAIAHGMIAEMETGEGKTLVATLPACALALAGVPVHIITVNDYLTQRDAEWMGPIYDALGLSVGTIVHGMDPAARRVAYACDVTYCTNKEVAFDYLRDRTVLWDRPSPIRMRLEHLGGASSRVSRLTMRGLNFAIVDEVDSVLVDEARTPLILSAEGHGFHPPEVYARALETARSLDSGRDFRIMGDRSVELTGRGRSRIDAEDWETLETVPGADQRQELVRQGLSALYLFERDKHYLVADGKVQIIDEFTGRVMEDRSWERGLHQLIEVKEGCEITGHKETLARISYQRFFRRYLGLAGMTGTGREVVGELWSVYGLRVVTIPTARPMKRHFQPDRVYPTLDEKWEAILRSIEAAHRIGRPVLVGTRSVEVSEHLSALMTDAGFTHRVLNARQDEEEAEIIAEAGQKGRITVATNMAGRGTDIRLGEGVAELGGLHVIATEKHEARRIDRQLFGRCGRQGDPGSVEAITSLDDEILEVYAGPSLRWFASVLLRSGGAAGRWFAMALFGRAQRTAEGLHSRMRRGLLKLDEQVSDSLAFSGRSE